MRCKSESIFGAIKQFKYYPFTSMEDFKDQFPDKTLEELNELAFARCKEFYGLSETKPWDSGNFVDGDSNSEHHIIEVTDSSVVFYGPHGVSS